MKKTALNIVIATLILGYCIRFADQSKQPEYAYIPTFTLWAEDTELNNDYNFAKNIYFPDFQIESTISENPPSFVKIPEDTSNITDQISNVKTISATQASTKKVTVTTVSQKPDDLRVQRIEAYLSARQAPLADYAQYMVEVADYYQIDYRLLPAISVIESNGGKYAYRPYNAWGWGGSNGYSFSSWEESIFVVGGGLAKYYAAGATTPQTIAPTYNPHTPNEWASKVLYVMSSL